MVGFYGEEEVLLCGLWSVFTIWEQGRCALWCGLLERMSENQKIGKFELTRSGEWSGPKSDVGRGRAEQLVVQQVGCVDRRGTGWTHVEC